MSKYINYEICNKILKLTYYENINEVTFNFPIRQVIPFDDCLVVRVEPDIGIIYNENVFGISFVGKILWQIEVVSHIYSDNPYTGMGKNGVNIKLYNWDGQNLVVDPLTGRIIKKGFSK